LQSNAIGNWVDQNGNEKYIDLIWMLCWCCWCGTDSQIKIFSYQCGHPQHAVGLKPPNPRQIEHWSL